jgi:hypothetical protein
VEDEETAAVQPAGPRREDGEGQPTPAELLGDIANRRVIDVWREVQRLGLDPRIVNAR